MRRFFLFFTENRSSDDFAGLNIGWEASASAHYCGELAVLRLQL